MKTKSLLSIIILFVSLMLVYTSCEKDDDSNVDSETVASVEDDVFSEELFEDVINEADNGISSNKNANANNCRKFTIDAGKITIEFDCDTTILDKQFTRKGKIHITYSGKFLENGFKKTVTFEDYSVNGNKIEGTIEITTKLNTDKKIERTNVLTGGKITLADGTVITRESTHTRVFAEGANTIFRPRDDVYEITGNASGTTAKGKNYTVTITKKLIIKGNCRVISEGIKEITVDGVKAILDFGDGTCDRKASLTVDGETKEITLGKRG